MMGKKGYIYTIDAVIAVIILIIGLLVIAGFYVYTPDKEKTEDISEDISGLLASVHVGDLCPDINDCSRCSYTSLEIICDDPQINILTNTEMSMLELFGLLYFRNNKTAIEYVINDTIIEKGILPENFEMQIILEDPKNPGEIEQIYPLIPIP